MKFQRKQKIQDYQERGRVVVIYGPRRVGKTTLLQEYLGNFPSEKTKYDTGDDLDLRVFMNSQSRTAILDYAQPFDVLAIDEAQQIESIGMASKMMIDAFPEKKIILTGSSSFDLSQSIGEPLVGRHYVMNLLPIAWSEWLGSNYEKKLKIEEMLVYGAYPEVINAPDQISKQKKLEELVSSYLLKDILSFDRLKSPEVLLKIVKALAFQVGSEVSLTKLAKDVGESDHKKVGRYIELLEKSFIIKKVHAFSTNPRKELVKPVKYYFYDLGIRNAVIARFQSIENRDPGDKGALWENFVFMELYKKSIIENKTFEQFFFWRNKNGYEIDIIITRADGSISAYECKWSQQSVSFANFLDSYPHASTDVASRETIEKFL
jgi:predicted AAA+ superfamily ATPase